MGGVVLVVLWSVVVVIVVGVVFGLFGMVFVNSMYWLLVFMKCYVSYVLLWLFIGGVIVVVVVWVLGM